MRLLLMLFVVLASTEVAAHGRDPYVTSLHFKPGDEQHVVAGTTFGLLVSHDGGASWRWMCERALHYVDPFDPDYAYAPSGAIFMQTSFAGVRVNRDGCAFELTALGTRYASRIEIGPDGGVYVAASALADTAIYKSSDGGTTFPQVATPGQAGDFWESLEVSPLDAQRVYLSGVRFGDAGRQPLLFKSTDGGATFLPLATASLQTTPDSMVAVVGIGPAADTVYLHVTYDASGGDAIYKSIDGGGAWTRIFTSADAYGLAFLARSNGDLVAATRTSGAWRSTDGGASWIPLANPPHISVLAERADGDVWAGTQSFEYPNRPPFPSIPPDGFAIMKSTDLVTWTPVLRVHDIAGPVACPAGTLQQDECVVTEQGLGTAWCCLVAQLQITATELDCTGPRSCAVIFADGAPGDVTLPPPDRGCCQGSSGPTSVLVSLALLALSRSRRPRAYQRDDR